MPQRFVPALFDRLIPDRVSAASGGCVAELDLEQLKRTVAGDLEDMLNTRAAIDPAVFAGLPACRASIVNYGLHDFSGLSLTSSADRDRVAADVRAAIERHEPRLRSVQARLHVRPGSIGRVDFAISALLLTQEAAEPIHFDAVFDASTQQYSVRHAGRTAR